MKTLLSLCSYALFLLPSPLNSQTLQWVDKNGPWNIRYIRDISVGAIPDGANVVYVASPLDGLLKTTDEGNSWTRLQLPSNINGGLTAVSCEKNNPNTLYVCQYDWQSLNLYKSVDGGATFTPINNGINNPGIIKICISPYDPSRILIGCYRCEFPCPFADEELYLTVNGGQSWQYIDFNGFEDNGEVPDIVWSTTNPNIVFLCSNDGTQNSACDNGTGIYRSNDAGSNWEKKVAGLSDCSIYSLASESDPITVMEYIYAGAWS